MTQFMQNGVPISEDVMHDSVVQFAINGYFDVPLENLKRIAKLWPNIALAVAPSAGTERMLSCLREGGYDWHNVAVNECVTPTQSRVN